MSLDLSRIRGLCFDVDGTIADTDDHIVAQVASLLHHVPLVSGRRAELAARRIVMSAAGPVNAAYGLMDRLHVDGPFHSLRARISRIRRAQTDPGHTRQLAAADEDPHEMMAGVQQMLKKLALHYPMCTISTGTVARVERFLEHYGVRGCFKAVVGAQTTGRMKPHPEPLLFAAKAMGVSPEHCLMIGDTSVDMGTGVSAGAQTVGVLCGFGTEEELRDSGAQLILPTTSDLLHLLHPEEDPLPDSAVPQAHVPPA